MRALYDFLGFICYGIAIYWAFVLDPNDLGNDLFKRAVSNEVMNQQYAFLGAIVISLIGTGFIIMGSRHKFPERIGEINVPMDDADKALNE